MRPILIRFYVLLVQLYSTFILKFILDNIKQFLIRILILQSVLTKRFFPALSASEFAHADIVLGLTILAYRYEGREDYEILIGFKFRCCSSQKVIRAMLDIVAHRMQLGLCSVQRMQLG
jgi:hypothetical protein